MIIDEEQFDQAWEATLSETGASTEKSVVILASLNEVDSVCATRIAKVCLREGGRASAKHPP
jgi:hypothetical protein